MNSNHRGNIVREAVKNSGYTLKTLAKKLEKSRGTLYKYFDQPDLDSKSILDIGRVIKHDFTKDIPELLEQVKKEGVFGGEEEDYKALSKQLEKDLLGLQKKYYVLLEEHSGILKLLIKVGVKREISEFKNLLYEYVKGHDF